MDLTLVDEEQLALSQASVGLLAQATAQLLSAKRSATALRDLRLRLHTHADTLQQKIQDLQEEHRARDHFVDLVNSFQTLIGRVVEMQVVEEMEEVTQAHLTSMGNHLTVAEVLTMSDAAFLKGRQLSKASNTGLRCVLPTRSFLRWLQLPEMLQLCEEQGRFMVPPEHLHDNTLFHISFESGAGVKYTPYLKGDAEGFVCAMLELGPRWLTHSDRLVTHTVAKHQWGVCLRELSEAVSIEKKRQFNNPELRAALRGLPPEWLGEESSVAQWDDMPLVVWVKQVRAHEGGGGAAARAKPKGGGHPSKKRRGGSLEQGT